MLLHQIGPGKSLLDHCLSLVPHVPHNRKLQLSAVLLLCRPELGGIARLRSDLLHHRTEVEPAAPELVAALFHGSPQELQLISPHVVEGPSIPRLVSGELDPVGPIIHAAITGLPVPVRHLDQSG